jgi:hypothetical protein
MCLDQEALGSTVLVGTGCSLVIAIPVCTYINAFRFARWNSDYRYAIFRLRQTVRRQLGPPSSRVIGVPSRINLPADVEKSGPPCLEAVAKDR